MLSEKVVFLETVFVLMIVVIWLLVVGWSFVSGIEVLFVWRQFLEWKKWRFWGGLACFFYFLSPDLPTRVYSVNQTIYSRKFWEKRWKYVSVVRVEVSGIYFRPDNLFIPTSDGGWLRIAFYYVCSPCWGIGQIGGVSMFLIFSLCMLCGVIYCLYLK